LLSAGTFTNAAGPPLQYFMQDTRHKHRAAFWAFVKSLPTSTALIVTLRNAASASSGRDINVETEIS
jgi:hypothetical protein